MYMPGTNQLLPGTNFLTLLLGRNLAGDCKLKPALTYQMENARALNGKDERMFPVIWKSSTKVRASAQLFHDWFSNHFVSGNIVVQIIYNLKYSHSYKLLLDVKNPCRIWKLILCFFLLIPRNTWTMDQTVIATVKKYMTLMNQAIFYDYFLWTLKLSQLK